MKIVIIGAGFAGMRLARKLNNKPGFEVVLIDKYNYHQFQPLFYQVATAALDPSNISFPLRKAFQKSKNVRIRIEEFKTFDRERKVVITENEEISYDVLVLALGADNNFFGNENLATFSFPMKSTVEALQLRHRLIQNFEDALVEDNQETVQQLLNIVVVGGGPTGVELAGALGEMKKYVLPKDYPEIDFTRMNIFLLEGGPKLLGTMSEKSSEDARRYVEKLGVTVKENTIVKDYDGQEALLADGTRIPTATLIWAAGVRGNVPQGIDKSLVVRGNRIKVDRQCRMEGFEDIYILGDLAHMVEGEWPNGHPQVASVAIQQADMVADNLKRIERKSTKFYEFTYKNKGSMATVGRNLAVVDMPKPKLHFRGMLAWYIWMGLHLFLILGVKNRILVFINWIYSYFTYDQSLRLIFKEFYRPRVPQDKPAQEKINTDLKAIPSGG